MYRQLEEVKGKGMHHVEDFTHTHSGVPFFTAMKSASNAHKIQGITHDFANKYNGRLHIIKERIFILKICHANVRKP